MTAVTATWTDPTGATLDKATDDVITEAMTDAWSSDLNALGGTTGRIVTGLRREWVQGANIASASALALGTDGNLFNITGTTAITSFTSVPQAGGIVVLTFAGALTLTHGSNIKLHGAANFTTAADSFIVLISDGTNMWEIARSGALGVIGTSQLAANAATQNGLAVGSSSGPTTTSTSYADLTDMSVTLTTTGGDLLCFFAGSVSESGLANAIIVAFSLDAAAEVGEIAWNAPGANYIEPIVGLWRFTGVSAASHTVKVRWKVDAGTATAQTTRRYLLVVELKK